MERYICPKCRKPVAITKESSKSRNLTIENYYHSDCDWLSLEEEGEEFSDYWGQKKNKI